MNERFLDLADPSFDVTGPEVIAAREEGTWARTSYGYALLRHAEVTALLKDRRFQQGNAKWPAQNGIHSGMFSDWWKQTLLSLEGQDHLRLRRLLNPAFKQGVVQGMVPGFAELAHELVDGFSERGSVELVSEFAEPYSSRILCRLLGLPEDEWEQVAHWADDLGKSFGVRVKEDLPRIEAALEGLYGYCDAVVRDRTAHPRATTSSAPWSATSRRVPLPRSASAVSTQSSTSIRSRWMVPRYTATGPSGRSPGRGWGTR